LSIVFKGEAPAEVSSGTTGHIDVVEVTFDNGKQYTSGIFYASLKKGVMYLVK
jgi:hypothetical protein